MYLKGPMALLFHMYEQARIHATRRACNWIITPEKDFKATRIKEMITD